VRESLELRVAEEFAHLLFDKSEGLRLSDSVRKVTLSTSDPRYRRVGDLQRRLNRQRDESFFFGWSIRRSYTRAELERAEWFSVEWTSTFEPEGEACGTVYDDTIACQHTYCPETTTVMASVGEVTFGPYTCGVGARQLTPLTLDGRRIPRGKDFARTIADEFIVSERARDVLVGVGATGVAFELVRYSNTRSKLDSSYQMVVQSQPVEIVAPTVAGIDPFDQDDIGRYRCPHGHTIGLNLLSELSIERPSEPSDVIRTRQCVGARVGVLRPRAIFVVSQKVRLTVIASGLKGWRFEVAHTSDVPRAGAPSDQWMPST
jgi:hypothetical protein